MNTIPCPLSVAAENHEKLPALIAEDKVVSYGEYEQLVCSAAVRLRAIGIAEGERVGIVSVNRWEYPVALFALMRLGAVACPISPRFPRETILSLLNKIDCATVVDPLDALSDSESYGFKKVGLDAIMVGKGSNIHRNEAFTADLERDATIIFTSGTSSFPKAVLHSFGNHYYSALGSNQNLLVQPGDCWLLSLPLYHVGGLGILFRTLLSGGAVVIPGHREKISESIEKYDVTHLSLVSTQLYRLLNDDELSFEAVKQLKAVMVGGNAVPEALVSKADKQGLPLYTTYGLTEMASQVTTTGSHDSQDHLFTSGRLLAYRDIKLDDDGEILVKGETLFKGYVDGVKVMLPSENNGWFRTGDLGRLDENGYLKVLGRKDNMFISGGENIHPEEIERALSLLDNVSEALVVPIHDQEFGFRPVAFIRSQEGGLINKGDIVSHLERYLPRFKIPISFYELPDSKGEGRLKPDRRYLARLAKELREKGLT